MKFDKDMYQSIVLRLLRHSNIIAIIMILIALYICFSANTWWYAAILGFSSVYLAWLTGQYLIYESNGTDESSCSYQYGCQVAQFNSRLSIVSNATISLLGIAFTIMIVKYATVPIDENVMNLKMTNIPYLIGLFKMLMIYMLSDKIHTSQLLLSVLYRYSQTIHFLNIDIDRDNPDNTYPLIFLSGKLISPDRYRVTVCDDLISVVFVPALSINNDSRIEYDLIKDDPEHQVSDKPAYDVYSKPTCLFRCHVLVRSVSDKQHQCAENVHSCDQR